MSKMQKTKITKDTKDTDFNIGPRSSIGGLNSSIDQFGKSKFHIGNTSGFKSPPNRNIIDSSPKFTMPKSPYLTPIGTKNRKFTEDFINRTGQSNNLDKD